MSPKKASTITAAPELIQINAGSQPLRRAAAPNFAAGGLENDLGQCSVWLSLQNV